MKKAKELFIREHKEPERLNGFKFIYDKVNMYHILVVGEDNDISLYTKYDIVCGNEVKTYIAAAKSEHKYHLMECTQYDVKKTPYKEVKDSAELVILGYNLWEQIIKTSKLLHKLESLECKESVTQYHEDDTDKIWEYIVDGLQCDCDCNVLHHTYNGKDISVDCNVCNETVATIKEEYKAEELEKDAWK